MDEEAIINFAFNSFNVYSFLYFASLCAKNIVKAYLYVVAEAKESPLKKKTNATEVAL